MSTLVLCVGKLKEKPYRQMADEYLKRLGRYGKYEEAEVPDLPEAAGSAALEEQVKAKEGEAILSRIRPGDRVIALTIPGKMTDSPALAESTAGYTCMEVVLPQPVKQFAAGTLKTVLGKSVPDSTLITDNTGRFSLFNRWYVLRHLSTRGISSEAIPYPYWENAARLAENHLALRLIPEGILAGFPAISLIILLLWLNHRRTWGLHSLKELVENAIDRKHQRDYDRQQNGDTLRQLSPRAQRREDRRARRQAQKALRYAAKNQRWKKH